MEGFLIHRLLGFYATLAFALLVLPAGYFTLFCREWLEDHFGGTPWLRSKQRAIQQLERLRARILNEFNALASRET